MFADTITVDGVTINETTYQYSGTGGEVQVNFSSPVSSFGLDVFAYDTYDKRVCVEFGGANTCLQGILATDPLNTPQPPNTSRSDFYFSISTSTPSDIAVVTYMAMTGNDEFYPPQHQYKPFLNFSSISTGTGSVQTPEPATFILTAGIFVVFFSVRMITERTGLWAGVLTLRDHCSGISAYFALEERQRHS